MEALATILLNGLLLVTLWWIYFVEYKRYRLDRTRQELFKIRDELFAVAASGVLPFNSKAYGLARGTLNGAIRFTHQIGFIRFVALLIADRVAPNSDGKRYSVEFDEALNALSSDGRKVVKESLFKMHLILISHIINNSLLLSLLKPPALFILRVTRKLNIYKFRYVRSEKARRRFAPLDAEAKHHCPV